MNSIKVTKVEMSQGDRLVCFGILALFLLNLIIFGPIAAFVMYLMLGFVIWIILRSDKAIKQPVSKWYIINHGLVYLCLLFGKKVEFND